MKQLFSLIFAVTFVFALQAQPETRSTYAADGTGNPYAIASIVQVGFTPEQYGCDEDSTTDDTPAFTAMIAAMPNRPCNVYLRYKTYLHNSTVDWTKPVSIHGQGRNNNMFNNGGTIIKTNSASINVWQFSCANFSVRDLSIEGRAATPTAGSGILVVGGAKNAPNTDYPSTFHVDNISIYNFYDLLNVQDAYQYNISNSLFTAAVNSCITVRGITTPDGGDSHITNCYFYARLRQSNYGIHQISSGGLTVSNSKFNDGGAKMLYCYAGDLEANTVILILTGNSYENFARSAVRLRLNGASAYKHVSITGGQCEPYIVTGYPYFDFDNIKQVSMMGVTIGANPGSSDRYFSAINCEVVTLFNNISPSFSDRTPLLTGSTYTHDLNNVVASTPPPAGDTIHYAPFNGTNGTSVASYTPPTGNGYTIEGTVQIQSNQAEAVGSDADFLKTNLGVGNVDYTAIIRYSKGTGAAGTQFVVRHTNNQNEIVIAVSAGAIALYNIVGGNLQTLSDSDAFGINDTAEHSYMITINGTSITLWIDGISRMNYNGIPIDNQGTFIGVRPQLNGKVNSITVAQ